eukprot:Skav213884  [mRNA]  locus=scaffold2374:229300:232019:- [translate_table: standard]
MEQASGAMMVEDSSLVSQLAGENTNDVHSVAELKEWATKDKLSMRFKEEISSLKRMLIPTFVEQAGLAIVNDEHLQKTRHHVPYAARQNHAGDLFALRTWPLFATGSDGEEEKELLQDPFHAWKQTPQEPENLIVQRFSDVLEGVGAFFSSMPCCGSRSDGLLHGKAAGQSPRGAEKDRALQGSICALQNIIRAAIPGAPKRQKVAFAMEKAAVMDLPQAHCIGKVYAGLGWDASATTDIDLDVSAVVLTRDCEVLGAVFFGQLEGWALKHSGDNLTGEGEGDDEDRSLAA